MRIHFGVEVMFADDGVVDVQQPAIDGCAVRAITKTVLIGPLD